MKELTNGGYFWENFVRDFFDTTDDTIEFKYGYYRPIISLSYMIDYAVWGLKPWGFHLSNIIFHTVSCILVYLIFNSLFNNRSISIITSLLFACHPIHTESVTWISGRTDIIAECLCPLLLIPKALNPLIPNETNSSLSNREILKLFFKQRKFLYLLYYLFAIAMFVKKCSNAFIFATCYTNYFSGLRNGNII